ncbi:hypothetical protein BDF14DRAFT_1962487 [Spinellus fusiger]|nr:hypothetical protein BDF14DRAFT_1992143 [Spinellus fusiger]KAI7871502.1 hypothetical protein BDF14DRAFT_1962487 [Spinellus fusiger]
MPKDNKKLSCKKYLKECYKSFRLVEFYEYFNFESRQEAENALKGAAYTLSKRPKTNTKKLNEVLKMIQANEYELLKCSAVELFWARVDAKNMQMKSFYILKTDIDCEVIRTIEKKQIKLDREEKDQQEMKQKEENNGEAVNKKRKYILDISEIQKSDNIKCQKLNINGTPEKRLSLSSIKIIKKTIPLPKYTLHENVYSMIKEWQTAINEQKDMFFPSVQLTTPNDFCIYNMLSTIFINTKKNSVRGRDNIKYKYSQSETDYIVKHVSCLLQNMFSVDDFLSIDWDITSFATKEIPQGYCAPRPDCIIISYDGVEVGNIEIKPVNAYKSLVDIDFCRIGELCKRQLHLRMKVAKTTKEFKTFGILINGYTMSFITLELNLSGEYRLIQHESVTIPDFAITSQHMQVYLETIISFKNHIIESLPNDQDVNSPCIYEQYSHLIKPTISFKNVKNAKNDK